MINSRKRGAKMLSDDVALGSTVTIKLWDGSTLQGTVTASQQTLATNRFTVRFEDVRPWQILAVVPRDDDAKEQLVRHELQKEATLPPGPTAGASDGL